MPNSTKPRLKFNINLRIIVPDRLIPIPIVYTRIIWILNLPLLIKWNFLNHTLTSINSIKRIQIAWPIYIYICNFSNPVLMRPRINLVWPKGNVFDESEGTLINQHHEQERSVSASDRSYHRWSVSDVHLAADSRVLSTAHVPSPIRPSPYKPYHATIRLWYLQGSILAWIDWSHWQEEAGLRHTDRLSESW